MPLLFSFLHHKTRQGVLSNKSTKLCSCIIYKAPFSLQVEEIKFGLLKILKFNPMCMRSWIYWKCWLMIRKSANENNGKLCLLEFLKLEIKTSNKTTTKLLLQLSNIKLHFDCNLKITNLMVSVREQNVVIHCQQTLNVHAWLPKDLNKKHYTAKLIFHALSIGYCTTCLKHLCVHLYA